MNYEPVDLKRYHSENANRYADLMSMIQDLKESYLHFHAGEISCSEVHGPVQTDRQLQTNAHWLAGATLYGRVFTGGGRAFNRDHFVNSLRPDLYGFHQWLLSMHDKHMSHAVNLFDEVMPTISRCNGDTGVGYIGVRVFNPQQSVLHQCLRFVREILRLLEMEAGLAYNRFRAEAEMLDDSFLQSLPAVTPPSVAR